jgi:hypothetical protein
VRCATLARKESDAPASRSTVAPRSLSGGLRIGEPHGASEQEADRVANEVMAGGAVHRHWSLASLGGGTSLQRRCSCGGAGASSGECEECKAKKSLQRKASGMVGPAVAPRIVHDVLNSPGRPLDRATRSFFEPRFGRDLSNVRVHADDKASESARSVSAHAYTVNQHVIFGTGRYQPATRAGRRLLAHELAHTIQQGGVASAPVSDGNLRVGATNDPMENEAHATAERMLGSASSLNRADSPRAGRFAGHVLQRQEDRYASLSITELRKLLKTDPEAVEALRLRYRAMSPGELKRYTASDAIAQSEYERMTIVPKEAEGTGPFSNRDVGDALEQELQRERAASGIPRRTSTPVTPGIKTEGGTLGTAKTDIPGLENRTFTGRSPQAGGEVNPGSKFPPATDPAVLPQTHGHAEQHLADQLEEALKAIPREQLKGKRVWMLIEQEPCSTCAQGVTDAAEAAGVLRKLSQEFPELTFEIKSLTSNSIIVLQGGVRTNVGGAAASAQNAPGGKGAGPTSAEVSTKIEVTNTVKQADGSTISDVEYNFGENLKQINEGAPAGAKLPSRIVVRVTQNAEGVITSVESLSGQPQALAEALAQRTLTPALASETGGAAEGAATGAGRSALLFKGLKIGGWAAFAVITGYQLYKATPKQRPKVVAEAAGGLAAGIGTTYLVCNALLDIETAGWGLVICGFIAGGAGGYGGSKVAGAAYDEYDDATASDLDRAFRDLGSRSANERIVFNIIVNRMGDAANCIDATFVKSFMSMIPAHLQDSEAVLLAAQLARASIAPPAASSPSLAQHFKKKSTVCPSCHGRSQSSLQPTLPDFDQKTFDAIMAAPTCSSILSSARSALQGAVGTLPRYQRAPGNISHHPEPGTTVVTPRPTTVPNAFPTVAEQTGKGACPGGGCHAPSGTDKPLLGPRNQPTDADRRAMLTWLQSRDKPAATGSTHATPAGVKLPAASQGFPSVEEQQGHPCPNCHTSDRKDATFGGFGGFGSGSHGELTDADRQKLLDFINAQGKK